MNKTQQKSLQKLVTSLSTGKTVIAAAVGGFVERGTRDSKGRLALGVILTKGAVGNYEGIETYLNKLGLKGATEVHIASTSTHSPVQNAKRAARALVRVAARQNVKLSLAA